MALVIPRSLRVLSLYGMATIVLVLSFAIPVQADSPPPELRLSEIEKRPLVDAVEFAIAAQTSTLKEARRASFTTLTAGDINQGISDRAYWLRMRIKNSGAEAKSWVLVHETSYLDNIDVYSRDADAEDFEYQQLSDRLPFGARPLDYRKLAFEDTTEAVSYTDVYLKVYYDKPDSVSLQFTIYNRQAFEQLVREENLLFGAYYGVLIVLIMIALIIGLVLQRTSVLNYALFLVVTAFQWLLLNGYGFQYLWSESVYWHNEGFHIAYLLFSLFGCEFSKTFLSTKERFPRIHRLLAGLQVIAILGVVMRLFGWYEPVLHLAFGLVSVVALILPLISAWAWRYKIRYARWYFFAWSIYAISLLLSLASAYLDIVPWGMHSLALLQWGSLTEAILLTVAITERLLSVETERRKAVEMANQDPLTGLGNRRLLQKQYERLRGQFKLDQRPVFLIMIDLDHFKMINDRYGHDAGDQVLREVADLLRAHCRAQDVCIRYGGEEFAVLLQADDIQAAWQIAERVRKEFAAKPTSYLQEQIQHTLSGGITAVLEGQQMLSVNDMMKCADDALYQGKAAGRNCNTIYRERHLSAEVLNQPTVLKGAGFE